MKWTDPDPLEMYARRRKEKELEQIQEDTDRAIDYLTALIVALCFIGVAYFVVDILL